MSVEAPRAKLTMADAGGGDQSGVEMASGAESPHVEEDEDDEGEGGGGGGKPGGPVGDAELLEEAHGAPVVEGGLLEPGLAVEDRGDGAAEMQWKELRRSSRRRLRGTILALTAWQASECAVSISRAIWAYLGSSAPTRPSWSPPKIGNEAVEQQKPVTAKRMTNSRTVTEARQPLAKPCEGCMFVPCAGRGGLLTIVHSIYAERDKAIRVLSELGEDALGGHAQRAVDGAAAGAAMAAAAEVLGDLGYVELSFAADAQTELAGVGHFAQKDGGFDAGDADEVVDDAFAVFGYGADAIHIFAGDPGPGEVAFGLEVGERDAKQTDLAGGVGEIDVAGDLAGVGPAGGEMVHQSEGVGGGAGVGEGTGVGEDCGVEAGGHGGSDLDLGGDGDAIDHGGYGAGVLVDPVDGGEGAAAGVVVDVDEGAAFEAEESGAGDAVAFEQDGGGVRVGIDVVCGRSVVDAVEVGQRAIGAGDGVGEDDVHLAAELVEDFGESEGGADGVAVGARVGGKKEAGVGAEGRQESGDVGLMQRRPHEVELRGPGIRRSLVLVVMI